MSTQKTTRVILLATALVCIGYIFTYIGLREYEQITKPKISDLSSCFENDRYTHTTAKCLRDRISTLLKGTPVRDVLSYTIASSSPVAIRNNCHAIGHIIGQETYALAQNAEHALYACSADCSSACIHGVAGSAVQNELGEQYAEEDLAHSDVAEIQRIGKRYCDISLPLCHVVGHILYTVNGDQEESFDVCDAISDGYGTEGCYQGIYMERDGSDGITNPFQEGEYEVRHGDYTFPCMSVKPARRHACFQFLSRFQVPLFNQDGIATKKERLEKSLNICRSLQKRDASSCIEGIALNSELFIQKSRTVDAMVQFCDGLPTFGERASCTVGTIPRDFFLGGFGLATCSMIKETNRAVLCYRVAFTWLQVYRSDDEIREVCAYVNDSACAREFEAFVHIRNTLPDYRFGLFGV